MQGHKEPNSSPSAWDMWPWACTDFVCHATGWVFCPSIISLDLSVCYSGHHDTSRCEHAGATHVGKEHRQEMLQRWLWRVPDLKHGLPEHPDTTISVLWKCQGRACNGCADCKDIKHQARHQPHGRCGHGHVQILSDMLQRWLWRVPELKH